MVDIVQQGRSVAEARPRGRHRASEADLRARGPVAGGAAERFAHEPEQGFCVICGTVWPCARSRRTGGPAHLKEPLGGDRTS